MKAKSILTDDMEHCYLCHRPAQCIHHIYQGINRQISDREGFTVPLCNSCHNMSDWAVHFNPELALQLKESCQRKYEETHSRAEFMKLIGRNYL